MSGTKRTPIARTTLAQISPEAVALYRRMVRVRCDCPPPPKLEYWKRRQCKNCARWWDLHSELADQIPHKPWQWPLLCSPTRYPDHDGVLRRHKPLDRQQELARALRAAARAMKGSPTDVDASTE